MRRHLWNSFEQVLMPYRKRSTTTSPVSKRGLKRQRNAKSESPASTGLEVEIRFAPQHSHQKTGSTPPPASVKQEPLTPVSPVQVQEVAKEIKESSAKMSPTKLRILESLGSSPFPDFTHPTLDECRAINSALVNTHGSRIRPAELNKPGLGANCGEVPSVLDALIRTILSQNTSNKNSSSAKKSLDQRFGQENYEAVRTAPLEEVVEALRSGGLANIKGARIKAILDQVHEKYGKLSLDHLHELGDEGAKRELMEFNGVGPKTASCVLLFCLRRESFAVDTHFRITEALGWIPAKANREQAFAHLDARVPEDLKYSLHALLITHGRTCANCAARGMPGNKKVNGLENGCPIKGILKKRPSDTEQMI